jgi:hypothetical protein
MTRISSHAPSILFLTETPTAKDCVALCGILHNHGYLTHFHAHITTSTTDTALPEAHIPAAIAHNGGGCMIAYNKSEP